MTAAGTNEGSVLVLLNPASGRRRARPERTRLEQAIRAEGWTLRTLDRDHPIEAEARRAVADGFGTIVAAGGDGTISAVATALAGSDRRLGVIPLGTFNFLARSMGIPPDPMDALHAIRDGADRSIALGEINGQIFVNNTSLGAYATVLEARETIYARWGRSRLAAYWSVLVAMATLYRPLDMAVTVDGTRHHVRSPMAFAAIRPYQLREYGLSGAEEVAQGQLALFLAPDLGRVQLLWRALKVLARRVRRGADYRVLIGRRITIETARPHRLVARDGERERMAGPYRITALPDALTVVVPRSEGGRQ